jgi:hypothetical protein
VGRYGDNSGADRFRHNKIEPDLAALNGGNTDYMPVVFPGFSWWNLKDGSSPVNHIPRHGGRFLWRQFYNAIDAGCRMIYVAMFDEVDEATAIYKVAENDNQTPTTGRFATLDQDGENLPSDWYLRLTGEAAKMLRDQIGLTSAIPINPEDDHHPGDIDNCPTDPDKTEPGDVQDSADNCPNDVNAGQADADGDGIGDACDPFTDRDNDGMPDEWETRNGLNPDRDDATADPDNDGISNLDEYRGQTDPGVYDENDPPDVPVPVSPVAHVAVSATPDLQTEDFYDPDSGDTHRQTQWQIVRQADERVVLDIQTSHRLTSLPVARLVLEPGTAYSWRARFYDNHGLASPWSQAAQFTTDLQSEDSDGNGILDDQEVDALLDIRRRWSPLTRWNRWMPMIRNSRDGVAANPGICPLE